MNATTPMVRRAARSLRRPLPARCSAGRSASTTGRPTAAARAFSSSSSSSCSAAAAAPARSASASVSVTDDDAFDYIVVGAGSAGCVMGNRLSRDPSSRVLVLEAGGRDTYPWIHVPLGYLYTMKHPRTSWGFSTTAQPGLNGRELWYPRGRVLGGCSSINGMIYQRGQRKDYDTWQELLGGDAWGWRDMRQHFDSMLDYAAADYERASEETAPGDDADADGGGSRSSSSSSHAADQTDWESCVGGEWHVEKQRLSWEVLDDFCTAANEAGLPARAHFNSSDEAGCGYFQVNQRSGFRLSAHGAFLRPVLDRPNLEVMTDAHVERISFAGEGEQRDTAGHAGANSPGTDGGSAGPLVAEGVVIRDPSAPGGTRLLRARKEVVLSAGAVGSPHILQCSGVGPRALLAEHGVEARVDLPGVGGNLQDHLQIRSAYRLKEGTVTLNSWKKAGSLLGQALLGAEYALFRTGPLSMAPSQFGLFAQSSEELSGGTPDLQFHIQPLSLDDLSDPNSMHKFPGLTTSVCNLRPSSRGRISLTGPSTMDAPAIDPNYLDTDHDKAVAAAALRLARRLVLESPSFARKYEPTEHFPGTHIESDEDLAREAGNISTSIFHPVGTCAMGRLDNPLAVVDDRLRVRGTRGLRVVDASIMPTITSGNTNSPTIAIAEKAASMMREEGGP